MLLAGMFLLSFFVERPVFNESQVLLSPSLEHLLGTDSLGRDVLLRVVQGARNSLGISLIVVLLANIIALLMASVLSLQNWASHFVKGVIQILTALPQIFWALIVVSVFKEFNFFESDVQRIFLVICAMLLAAWCGPALTMAEPLIIEKQKDYILAAKALGSSRWQILKRHLWPYIKPTLLMVALFQWPQMVLLESSLSFLGLGIEPPQTSWGALVLEGWRSLSVHPHLLLGPALVIFIASFSMSVFAERFRR
jgi:oligopeptide transport system permease protein